MEYVGRDVWGARHDAGSGPRPIPCTEAWLHHTATATLPVTASEAKEREVMRAVEAIGEQRFGRGFSYNLAIFPSGRVYVGCGVRRVGSHTGGRNTRALGIVLVGNFDAQRVPAPMRAALVEVLRDAKRMGWLTAPRLNGGHRDVKQTACPGRYGYALIPGVNAEAASAGPPPPPAPPAPAPHPQPTPAPANPVEGHMARLVKKADDPHVWATDGLHRWHVPTTGVLADLRATGVYGDGQVHVVSDLTVDALVLVTGDTNAPSPYDEQPA